LSSAHENEFPAGVHAGFKNLIENDTNCDQLKPSPGDLCINAYALQIHAAGTNAHALVAVHSWKGIFLVCGGAEIDASCGIVATGGWHDYGLVHAPYKKYECVGPDSLIVPDDREFITPYTALATENLSLGQNRIYWNSLGAPVMDQYFAAQRGYLPNRGLVIAWSEIDAWDMVSGFSPACADPVAHVDSPYPAHNGTAFQVFSIRYELPTVRPFVGWTDRHGNVRPSGACTAEGLDCVPLVIEETVPQGRMFLNRNPGEPHLAPVLEFDDGTPLKPPPFDLDE
jgi:hypothetical protein